MLWPTREPSRPPIGPASAVPTVLSTSVAISAILACQLADGTRRQLATAACREFRPLCRVVRRHGRNRRPLGFQGGTGPVRLAAATRRRRVVRFAQCAETAWPAC